MDALATPDLHSLPPTSNDAAQDRDSRDRDQRDRMSPIDIADRIVALQRRKAAAAKPRERPARTPIPAKRRAPSPPQSHLITAKDELQDSDPNAEDFNRRLHISTDHQRPSPLHKTTHGKLHHLPDGLLPARKTTEPESLSESSSTPDNAYWENRPRTKPPTKQRESQTSGSRQLYDYRKEPPVRFQPTGIARPTPMTKSSGDTFVSASSTSASSYAHSIGSSFTLTSNSTGTSGSSLSGLNQPRGNGEGSNAFVAQLKILYRDINALEQRLISEDTDLSQEDEPRYTLQARSNSKDELREDKFLKLIRDHKQLADMMQNLMKTTLAPQVPTSVHTISTKYNIPTRLWGNAFHRVLETLRRASTTSPIALEHLTDMIFWAYSFYTALVEDPQLESFKNFWIEALGDLARYRMAIATFNPASDFFGPSAKLPLPDSSPHSDDSPSPSIGIHAAQALEVEPERDQWRGTARRWYALGLTDTPGNGRLHHHLGLLSRDTDIETLRAVYHFAKSLTVLHPFTTSRESILPLFSVESQRRRALPDATPASMFLLLQGMLFTHIQLDDFSPTLDRLMERLALDSSATPETFREHKQLEERDWIMFGVLNITAMLEYGKPSALLKNTNTIIAKDPSSTTNRVALSRDGEVKLLAKHCEPSDHGENVSSKPMEVDELENVDMADMEEDTDKTQRQEGHDVPAGLQLAVQLAFSLLRHTLRNPTRKATPFSRSTLNPYIDIILTFLAHCMKLSGAIPILERVIPWNDLVAFLNTAPESLLAAETDAGARITQGCAPLPEDWCMRGMEWAARRTYERGFWKSDSGLGGEQTVLNLSEIGSGATDGIIEDDDDDDVGPRRTERGETSKRWTRCIRASLIIARSVDGFQWQAEDRVWKIGGKLAENIARWQLEDRASAVADELQRRGRRATENNMEVDDESLEYDESGDSESPDDGDSSQVKDLKARRRYLRDLLQSNIPMESKPTMRIKPKRVSRRPARPALHCSPGYTVLVVDTNILLSALSEFQTIVDSQMWTVVVPLAVITELDGLGSNDNELGAAAHAAVSLVTSHIRSHSICLKVQTSRGNYLSNLSIRSEDIQFEGLEASWERSMDDLILKAAVWQDDHWSDRSKLLLGKDMTSTLSLETAKVVLLSFDRNLRLKARARQLHAADQKELAAILVSSKR